MADLSELYKSIAASAPDPLGWQKGLAGQYQLQSEELALQEKRRQIAEEQRLRELFQRNQSPTAAELGAISPSFMQQYGKNQFDMMKQQSEMQNMQTQISERVNKMAAGALGANADQYDADVASGMSPQIALDKFHSANANAIRQLQESGLPIPAGSYDPESITPDSGHRAAQQFGIITNKTKAEFERQGAAASAYGRGTVERQLGPMPSYEQQYGGVEMTPQGPMYKPPVPTMQPAEIPQGATSEALTDDDIRMMQQQFRALPNGSPEKARIGAMLADAVKQQLPSGRFITPEERQQRELKGKVDEETATKQAAQKLEDQKAIDSYFRGRPPEQIRQLIRESIAGDVESGVARIAKTFGVSVPGGSATAALKTITQQLIEGSPYAPGSQSNVEYIARLEKIGNPASNEPIKDRLAALDEFLRERQAFIANKAELSQEELIDAVANGFIDKESALKIRKRTLTKAGAPQ
jgi:hypothetical protein